MARMTKKTNSGNYTADAKDDVKEHAKEHSKEVEVAKHHALVNVDEIADDEEIAAAKDTVAPRLAVLQGNSPQLDRKHAEYVKDACAGQICDVAYGEAWDEINIVPCYYAVLYLEWAPREAGEGLINNFGTDPKEYDNAHRVDERFRRYNKEGNEISQTATLYCLNLDAGARPSFFPMAHTALKAAGNLVRRRDYFEPGKPYKWTRRIYKLTSDKVEKKGNKWYTPIFHKGALTAEFDTSLGLLKSANDFADMCKKGLVRGDFARDDDRGENVPF